MFQIPKWDSNVNVEALPEKRFADIKLKSQKLNGRNKVERRTKLIKEISVPQMLSKVKIDNRSIIKSLNVHKGKVQRTKTNHNNGVSQMLTEVKVLKKNITKSLHVHKGKVQRTKTNYNNGVSQMLTEVKVPKKNITKSLHVHKGKVQRTKANHNNDVSHMLSEGKVLKKSVSKSLHVHKGKIQKTKANHNNDSTNACKKIRDSHKSKTVLETSEIKNNHELDVKHKIKRNPITHQNLFLSKKERRKHKVPPTSVVQSVYDFNPRKLQKLQSLRERMIEKLKAARFRYLNEQMYLNTGEHVQNYFESDPTAYTAYHEGYQHQVTKWPLNPVDTIINKVQKLSKDYIIADFGCGEAKLAQSVPHKVHSFDFKAINEHVTPCNMANVPLKNNSVDVAVFCLSLMGTNLNEYILEAKRVLKKKGLLMLAEVESRFEDVDNFIKNLSSYGFINTEKDFSHNIFCFLDFVKSDSKIKNQFSNITLKPCLYKKR